MTVAAIIGFAVFTAYWRRIRGGGWWPSNRGPWWAGQVVMDVWLGFPLYLWLALGVGIDPWPAAALAGAFVLMWNPGHAGLSCGRDPHANEAAAAQRKPLGRIVRPLANLVSSPGTAGWCAALLSLDYGVRTLVVAAIGAVLVDAGFWAFAPAGLLTGPLYLAGWAIWERGWRPVFMQPEPEHQGGHLIGEWLNGGWFGAALAAAALT
jgi:hypothetical protein